MGKYNDDLVWAGLGIGAIYLVYKLTKPITESVEGVSKVTTTLTDDVSNSLKSGGQFMDNIYKFAIAEENDLLSYLQKTFNGSNSDPGLLDQVSDYVVNGTTDLINSVEGFFTNKTAHTDASQAAKAVPLNYSPTPLTISLATGQNAITAVTSSNVSYVDVNKIPVQNNADLANQLIAQKVQSTVLSSTSSSTPKVEATYNPRTGQTVNLVRSSVLAPISSNGKRYKV